MIKEPYNLNGALNEFAFARIMEDVNTMRMNNEQPVIMATQCRAMHTALLEDLKGRVNDKTKANYTIATATKGPFLDGCKAVLKESSLVLDEDFWNPRVGEGHPAYDASKPADEQIRESRYEQYKREFTAITGFELTKEGAQLRASGKQRLHGYFPISPFQNSYAHRSTVLKYGTEILYAKASDMLQFVPDPANPSNFKLFNTNATDEKEANVDFYRRIENHDSRDGTVKIVYREAGKAYTNDDAVGLSRLRPYMTEKDYASCSGWMTKMDVNDRMSPQAMDRAAGVLQYLTNEGKPYKVSKDMRYGQLKADIGNTKQSIRVTDVRKNEAFIGRGYKNGISMYLGTSKRDVAYVPSMQETEMLLDYMLGGQPRRMNNFSKNVEPLVGNISTYTFNNKTTHTTYMSVKEDGNVSLRTSAGYSTKTLTQNALPLTIRTQNNHSSPHMRFTGPDDAQAFLEESIQSAKEKFISAVDIDMLLSEAAEHADDENYTPVFSSESSIATLQAKYWDVLIGKRPLYKPTENLNDDTYAEFFSALADELGGDDIVYDSDDSVDFSPSTSSYGEQYEGTVDENVKQHLRDSLDILFGSFEPDATGRRFNPSLVASFMDSPNGIYRNNDNIVAAMCKLEFNGDELRGDDFQTKAMKDRLLRFDVDTAVRMDTLDSPFMKTMYEQVKTTLETTACRINPEDVLIDDNGVVQYTAYQTISSHGDERKIVGTIGQIFEPDEHGLIETRYNGSQNRLFSPGYNAFIQLPTAESGSNFMERTRLRGLSQVMAENIALAIRADLTNGDEEPIYNEYDELIGVSVGTTTNINNTYRSLYTTDFKVSIEPEPGESLKDTYLRQTALTGMPLDVQGAVFETASRAFRFGNEYRDNSTVDAESRHKEVKSVHALTNDNILNYYNMTNHTNLSVTISGSKGYSDDVQTGSGKNQGATRYMGVGVEVDGKTGEIIPVKDESDELVRVESPLRKLLTDKFGPDIDAKPADRAQMVTSNLQSASGVAGWDDHVTSKGQTVNGVGVAQLTLQGLTFDDGAVISKHFAESNQVITDGGKLRPLAPGDKICDFSGNKSIIAKVIDPEMDLKDAEKEGILPSVELFRANPDLDVVQAPYSAVSRFNAAGSKLAMRTPMELNLPDGTSCEGCLGFAPVIITKHTANDHTKLYSEEQDVPSNEVKGRKISAQLGWALSAKGAESMMDEIFSSNNSATTNFREVLNVMGLDMDEVGTLRKEYQPHYGEERHIFHLPDMDTIKSTAEKDLVDLFRDSVDSRGGFLEIPFPVQLPSGQMTQQVPVEKASRTDRPMYQLPVLSSHLRSGQSFEDGTSKVHDYTNQYARIFTNALKYMKAEAAGDKKGMAEAEKEVNTSYSVITDELKYRKFETKHNMMRDDFMAKRMPHSATAVWTPDTRLNLNQIAMNSDMMCNMDVKDGDYVLIWRDPLLRDYGVRYMQVKQDDSLCGVAVNPLVAVGFDGDFDGDSVGMWKPSRKSSQKEAMRLFSVEMNMLDFTKVLEKDEKGNPKSYKLMFNTGMDVVSAEIIDEKKSEEAKAKGEDYGLTLRERRVQLEQDVNSVYQQDMPWKQRLAKNRELLDELSEWAKDTLCDTCGTEIVSYNSLQEHMQSLVDMVDHGAKGSHKKLGHYAKYLGVTYDVEPESGRILSDSVKIAVDENGKPKSLITEQDIADTEKSTAIKSHGTGNAGAVSQRVVKAMRNHGIVANDDMDKHPTQSCLSSALQLTYLSTQGILQAKHDPVQAQILYDAVKGPIRELWRGRLVELKENKRTGEFEWKTKFENGEAIQATKQVWIDSFMKLHTSEYGLDLGDVINIEHVKQVAESLYDSSTGRMYDIENDKTIQRLASPMDILAYTPNNAFETLCDMADREVNIFDGKCNAMFMPKIIKNNQAKLLENQEKFERGEIDDVHVGLRPIVKNDVKACSDVLDKKAENVVAFEVHDEASHDEASHDEASHDEASHDEASHDEASHDEASHDEDTAEKNDSSFDFTASVPDVASEKSDKSETKDVSNRPLPDTSNVKSEGNNGLVAPNGNGGLGQ